MRATVAEAGSGRRRPRPSSDPGRVPSRPRQHVRASGRSRSCPPKRSQRRTGLARPSWSGVRGGRGDRAARPARPRPAPGCPRRAASGSSSARRWSTSTGEPRVVRTPLRFRRGGRGRACDRRVAGRRPRAEAGNRRGLERHGRDRPDARAARGGRLDGRRGDPNCRLMVHYDRTTKDGRIAFGQGGHRHAFGGRVADNFFAHSERPSGSCGRTSPPRALRGQGSRSPTAGAVRSTTRDGAPIFGRFQGRVPLVYGVGYSGTAWRRA